MVVRRWATTKVVRPCMSRANASCTSRSEAASPLCVSSVTFVMNRTNAIGLLTTLARVGGPHVLAHTSARSDAFREECDARSIVGAIIEGDYTEENGRHAARSLLGRPETPTAIVFDNDIMALAALPVAQEMGISVPSHLSLPAWDDSAMCRLASPPLSAMMIDVHGMGQLTGTCVLNTLAGGPPRSHGAPLPRLTARGSTGAPAPAPAILEHDSHTKVIT